MSYLAIEILECVIKKGIPKECTEMKTKKDVLACLDKNDLSLEDAMKIASQCKKEKGVP